MREYAFQPVRGEDAGGARPFLWIQKAFDPPPSEERLRKAKKTLADYDAEVARIIEAWHRRLGSVTGGAMRVVIDRPGIGHIDFSDESLWDTALSADARAGKLATIADTRAWVRAFLDGAVRGDWAALRKLAGEPGKSRPEVTVHAFGRMGP